ACARLAGVGLRAGVAVVAGCPVRQRRVRARPRTRVTGPRPVALVRRRAGDRRPGLAGPRGVTGLGAVAGVAVAARGAGRRRRVGAGAVGVAGVDGARVAVVAGLRRARDRAGEAVLEHDLRTGAGDVDVATHEGAGR